jgi:ceramide glucosyltransferase
MLFTPGGPEILAWLVVAAGASQIALAARCVFYFRKAAARAAQRGREPWNPEVVVICPCKGLEPNFARHVSSMLSMSYERYRMIFAIGQIDDPAYRVVQSLTAGRTDCRVIVSGIADNRGDKLNNLLAAVESAEAREADVLAFVDSDVDPPATWLHHLVAPLSNREVGVSTGYRRYEGRAGFWSAMRAVGNNVGMAPYFAGDRLLMAWGGSMAIRRHDFDRCGVSELWQTALDDDLTLAAQVRALGLRIEFVPDCMMTSYDRCTMRQYYDWLMRQMLLTRLYCPALWRAAFMSLLPIMLMAASIVLGLASFAFPGVRPTAFALALVIPLQMFGGVLTALSFRDVHTALWVPAGLFVSGAVSMVAYIASGVKREVEWRGVRYLVQSPYSIAVLDRTTEEP